METLNDEPYYGWGWKKSGNGWEGAAIGYWRDLGAHYCYPEGIVKALGSAGYTSVIWHYQKLEVMTGKITHHCVLLPGNPRYAPGVLQVWLSEKVNCDYWYRQSGSSATFLKWKGGWIVPSEKARLWVNGRTSVWKG